MYAIIESGGKQYRVSEGDKVKVELLPGNADDTISLSEVLVISDGDKTIVGSPYIEGASVTGKIVAEGKKRKLIVFKFKRRKDMRKKKGHRQMFTELQIEKISMEAAHGA